MESVESVDAAMNNLILEGRQEDEVVVDDTVSVASLEGKDEWSESDASEEAEVPEDEDVVNEEAPADDAPAEDAPAEDAPAEDAPDDAKAEELKRMEKRYRLLRNRLNRRVPARLPSAGDPADLKPGPGGSDNEHRSSTNLSSSTACVSSCSFSTSTRYQCRTPEG